MVRPAVVVQSGHGEVTLPFLGWGTNFLDFDNDGWKDIVIANGHVYPMVDAQNLGTRYAEQVLMLRNTKNWRFERAPAAPGSGLTLAIPWRGLVGDLDGHRRLDVIINNIDTRRTLLRNVTRTPNGEGRHWWI